ncbi:bifunctional DNA primase/polymerase [Arthrobacter sp. TMN-50]
MYEQQQRRPGSRSKAQKALRAAQTEERARLQAHNLAITDGLQGKKHANKKSRAEASTEPEILKKFGLSDSTIVDCNKSGENGLVLVDVDMNHAAGVDGRSNLKKLLREHGIKLPRTFVVRTPRGGIHLYFWQLPHHLIGCSAGKLAPGVDIRGRGGIAVAPPTPDYKILRDEPIQPLPVLLHQLLTVVELPKRQATAGGSAKHNVAGILATLSGAQEGQRNSTLHWALCRISELPSQKQRAAIWNTRLVAQELGLKDWEIDQTVASALGANRG